MHSVPAIIMSFTAKTPGLRPTSLKSNMLRRDIPGIGAVEITGFRTDEWISNSHRLWSAGQNVTLYEPDGYGGYGIVKHLAAADYIPLGMELSMDDRRFVIDSVNFTQDKVSLRGRDLRRSDGFSDLPCGIY